MFVTAAAIVITTTLLGVVVDDELYRLLNTIANFTTVALLVWHQQHVRKHVEPEVKDTAAVVRRELGTRTPGDCDPPETYNGPERRRNKDTV